MIENYQTLIILVVSFLASMLTFYSGFGLGTILTPVFALFFPLPIAIGLTAIVHLLNNLFKLSLTFKNINQYILVRFGIPGIFAALIGALSLENLKQYDQTIYCSLLNYSFTLYLSNIILGSIILIFVLIEILPFLKNLNFNRDKMIVGGLLSGFFGGLSGHQGAFRSMFLVKSGLDKESFIATGIVIACFIDCVRIPVYIFQGELQTSFIKVETLLLPILAAFAGAYLGNRYLKKVTIVGIQYFVSIFLVIIAIFIIFGEGH